MKKQHTILWLVLTITLVGSVTGAYKARHYYFDVDGDGYSLAEGDCEPNNEYVFPDASEKSFDLIDQNCDGKDYVDADNADNDGDGFTPLSGDCDDVIKEINPNAEEMIGDDFDNDCDGRQNEITKTFSLLDAPLVTDTSGKEGAEFLASLAAHKIAIAGKVYEAKLHITATTIGSNSPDSTGNSIAIKIYAAKGTPSNFYDYINRGLDAKWKGNGKNHLDTSSAAVSGGVFFAGQTRTLNLNLSALPVSSASYTVGEKESIDLLRSIEEEGVNGLIIGFYTSAPTFGVIEEISLTFETSEDAQVTVERAY